MLVRLDGMANKELSNKYNLLKFLKENTHSGKVAADLELFKAVDVKKDSFHWVMSTFDTDRDFEKVDPKGWNLKNYLNTSGICLSKKKGTARIWDMLRAITGVLQLMRGILIIM